MTKQELQQVFKGLAATCIVAKRGLVIEASGALWSNGTCYTAEALATIFTEGRERRCHEALVKEIETVDFSHAWAGVLHERLKESKQALAEGE